MLNYERANGKTPYSRSSDFFEIEQKVSRKNLSTSFAGPPLLSGEAFKQCPHSPKWKTSPTALWKRHAASIRHSFQHCGKPFRMTAEVFSTKNPPKRKTCGKRFFAKNSRFRRSAGADSKKPPVFVENALRFLWNTLKMKSIFCTILLKNAYLSLHFASFRV